MKALTKVAASPLRIDLRPILGEAIPMLGSFLRKNQRALKLSTLTLLDVLVNSYHNSMNPQLLNKVLNFIIFVLIEEEKGPYFNNFFIRSCKNCHCYLAKLIFILLS